MKEFVKNLNFTLQLNLNVFKTTNFAHSKHFIEMGEMFSVAKWSSLFQKSFIYLAPRESNINKALYSHNFSVSQEAGVFATSTLVQYL